MAFSRGDFSDWSLLGEGGEAEIFRARQVSLDRMVAIKRLKLSSIGGQEEIKRFEREAKLCASLSHPCLVQIYDYGSDGKFYHLVMEYVAGVDLGKMAELGSAYVSSADARTGEMEASGFVARSLRSAEDRPALPESLKVHLARQMVEVVDFFHRKGLLHRDLKPENFMADLSGRIVLLDLGMARSHASIIVRPDSRAGMIKGTLAYIPPELLRGGRLETVSEYYSLALVLLELFSGARYYRGKSADEVVNLIQKGVSLDDIIGVPSAVKALLAPYLAADPAARPPTLDPLLRGLKGMQSNTLALSGGKEALEAVIRAEQKAWLWALVKASEGAGEVEGAFARLRELLEADPGNADVQAKFREIGMRLNDSGAEPPPAQSRGWSWRGRRPGESRDRFLAVAALVAVIAVAGGFFYLGDRSGFDDLGRELVEREMDLLSKETDSVPVSEPPAKRRPALRPYGVLVVTGIPKEYRLLVNRVRYPAGGEIHLPANRHLIEVEDAGSRKVLRDSVAVGGGEPTVYDFTRRAGKP